MGLHYRTLQFLRTIFDKPNQADLKFAHEHLSASLQPLFSRMSPSDQAHSIRVCRWLLEQGCTDPDLLTAALLHDVGKCVVTPRIWERVLVVLANQIAPRRVLRWSEAEARGWKRPFVIAHKHPDWGAELVAAYGGTAATVQLIQNHQAQPSQLPADQLRGDLSLLQAADSAS